MTARSSVVRPVMPPGRPAIRDLNRRHSYAVEWDVRPAFDLVLSLSAEAGQTDDLPTRDREWLAAAKAGLRAELGDALELFASEFCTVLAIIALDRPEVRSAADFVALLDATDEPAIIRTLFFGDRDTERQALVERAMNGDEAAVDELLRLETDHRRPESREAIAALYRDPAAGVAAARTVLRAWLPRFEEVETRVAGMIDRDFAARAGDRASLDPTTLVERTTGGIRWLPEPGIRRVILAPSYFARPYNFVLSGADWRMFAYPIADAALDEADPLAPPQTVVRLHRALGDETRLRILKLLTSRDWYLSEIAQQLELSKPTIKHHLALLRAAGLVTLTEEGSLSYYSLRRDRVAEGSAELGTFLGT
ncbi:MAG TPA: metalloregulator ArsR/SmtB family transcription factor [Candidatus Limnocylindrales bacterium]|nr:metalloregulator ArsR/SmtB family transcription factor [Candidatus Limnocylindrales bacterium]